MRGIAARIGTAALLGACLGGPPGAAQAAKESIGFYGVVPDASGFLRGPDGALLALEGELRSTGSMADGSPFEPTGPPGAGLFRVLAHTSKDLRTDPGRMVLETPTGRVVALRLSVNELGSAPAEAGEDLLAQHQVNQQLFAVICSSSIGFSSLDPARCGSSGSATLTPLHPPAPTWPSLPLIRIQDGARIQDYAQAELTDQQQALLGCGPFYGTPCEPGGVDLLNTEASFLLQSWPGFEGTPEAVLVPQPGTVGFGRRDFVWDRGIDGPLLAGDIVRHPFACEISPVLPDGSTNPDAVDLSPAELGCQQWQSQGAALSWNALVGFAALSAPDSVLDPSASLPAGIDELDTGDLYRTDGCSFLRPQLCREVRAVASLAVTELDDDPSGEPRLRWFHESGAAYKVVEARGAFDGYLGGTLHAFGPVVAAVEGAAAGVPMLLVPPACNDGLDNDGDELADYPEDPSCRAPAWDSEDACGRDFAQALVLIVPLWGTRRLARKRVR